VEAFVADTLDSISVGAIRATFERRIGSWMTNAGEPAA
jgi:hypothetical protein